MKKETVSRQLREGMRGVRVSPQLRVQVLTAAQGRKPGMNRTLSAVLAAVLLLAALSAVALAAGRAGMLDFIGRFQDVEIPPDAADYIVSDTASLRVGGATACVRELYYDGRTVRLTIDVTPDTADMLLLGPDCRMDDAWSFLTQSGQGGEAEARTVLDVYHERGYASAWRVNVSTQEEAQGTAGGWLDYVLGEDGTLTLCKQQLFEDDRAQREVTLRLSLTPLEFISGSEDQDHAVSGELTLPLTAAVDPSAAPAAEGGLEGVHVSEEPVLFSDCGVRVDRLLIEEKPQELYATIEYTVVDPALFAQQEGGLWFEFIDPASTADTPSEQRLTAGMTATGEVMPLDGDAGTATRYVQRQTLGKSELRGCYTLRAFNCWSKERFETHELSLRPATREDLGAKP